VGAFPTPEQFHHHQGPDGEHHKLWEALGTIIHELVHVRQYREMGYATFEQMYLVETVHYGYAHAPLEEEAAGYSSMVMARFNRNYP
jgi:hypothetical protein